MTGPERSGVANNTRAELKLNAIEFASGPQVVLKPDTILVLVGPNNAGKSVTLRDLFGLLRRRQYAPTSVKRVQFQKFGSVDALERHFAEWGKYTQDGARWFGGQAANPASVVRTEWQNTRTDLLGVSTTLFALLVNADARIEATKPAQRIALEREEPRVPIHHLERKIDAELEVSEAFAGIFGEQIALNRNAGTEVPIHVGVRPDAGTLGGELSVKYSEEVAKLPLIGDQGDGMIAFLGLLLYVVGVPRDIYLIDEPDVYLHPPQAFAAGHLLAKKSVGRQLIIATHNSHLLRGLLDGAKERLRIVRLDRTTGAQSAKVVDPALFDEARNDPILKFTPILEALFYNWVIVCEDESDCLFYRGVLEENGLLTEASPVFWIASHGKQNSRKIVGVLRSLGVQTISIVDFDVVNDENVLRELVEAHGGVWSDFEKDARFIKKSIEARKPTKASNDIKKEISAILENVDSSSAQMFPSSAEDAIREVMKGASPWRELKASGLHALDAGEATKTGKSLLSSLSAIGIWVPPVGETESFCKTLGGHGIKWVAEALKRNLKTDPEFADAREFVRRLAATIGALASKEAIVPDATPKAT